MKKVFHFLFRLLLKAMIFSVLLVLFFKWVPVPVTPLMVIRGVSNYQDNKTFGWKHQWVSIKEISPHLQKAVICSEDQRFIEHNGFDLEAIEKALEHNKTHQRLRGASTISQQTAKNIFLWPGRSWIRKGLEAWFTFLIELLWSKERILEVYLNSIEMGNGVYGAEAAAKYWFGKSAARLSMDEAAALAAILPNPLKYKANPPTAYIARRKAWIVRQMYYFGPLKFDAHKDKTRQKDK
ncbi:monofunctional biosynthetic peptidoglycan transglycosylase [Ascidiimonas aurantiaca]|uniref:monofunctional biosynthetic peptidoglycan transglycosylase n=1 Tax=Ascidiimonas aurantiaca TaxID=1685432 RepID=UPI0030EF0424